VATPTLLQPVDERQPPWTLFELAGHFDISIGLARMLMADPQQGQVGRDRVSFFIFPRAVEAVVHGMDLTDAIGRGAIATPEGIAMTAAILDELLARRTVAGRPADLTDDLAWIRAAAGRAEHPDPHLPVVG
jgi:hypothetical protein